MLLRCRLDFEDADKFFLNRFKELLWVLKQRIIIDRLSTPVSKNLCTNVTIKFLIHFLPVHMRQNLVVEETLEEIGTQYNQYNGL